MTTITTRAGKGSPLTNTEVDDNFSNLNSAKYESGSNVSFGGGSFTSNISVGGTEANNAINVSRAANSSGVGASSISLQAYTTNPAFNWTGGTLRFLGSGAAIVFNEDSNDMDFRVESNDNTHMLFVDASTNRVGIGAGTAPNTTLDIHDATDGTIVSIRGDGTTAGGRTIQLGVGDQTHSEFANFSPYIVTTASDSASTGLIIGAKGGTSADSGVQLWSGTVAAGMRERLRATRTGDLVINEQSYNTNFRVESNDNANMIFVDGDTNRIGIGHSSPDERLHAVDSADSARMPFVIGNEDHTDDSTSQEVRMGFGLSRDSGTVKNDAGMIAVGKNLAWTNADLNIDSFMGLSIYKNNVSTETMRIEPDKVRLGNTSDYVMVDISASNAAIQLVDNTQTNPPTLRGNGSGFTIENGGVEKLRVKANDDGVIVNEPGGTMDFRVESDSNSHMLYVDGGENVVTMGMANPTIPSFVGNNSVMMADNLYMFQAADSGESNFNISQDNNYVYLVHNGYWNGAWKQHNNGFGVQMLQLGSSQFHFTAAADVGADDTTAVLTNIFRGGLTEVCVNDSSGNVDFRVESNDNANMLFVDASTNRVYAGGLSSGSVGTAQFIVAAGSVGSSVGDTLRLNQTYYGTGNNGSFFTNRARRTDENDVWTGVVVDTVLEVDNSADIYTYLTYGIGNLVVNETGADQDFRIESNNNTHMLFVDGGNNGLSIGNTVVNPASGFSTQAGFGYSSTGQVQIAATSSLATLVLGQNQGTNGSILDFRKQGNIVGSVSVTGAGTSYNTTSDRRLKDNIETITDGTDKLMAMNPVTHTWKADPEADAVHGFIAQEMMGIVPEAVSGEPEGEEMMSMDYGRITPVLVAALQDAHKKIAELETRLNELEGN